MTGIGFWPWALVIIGGTIALGIAIAYGIMHNWSRTRADRALTDHATHELYEREEREGPHTIA